MIADSLERNCQKALEIVKKINTNQNKGLLYEVADIRAWSYLGLHFAEKIRGGVALETYRQLGGEDNKQIAIANLKKALGYWDNLISVTKPLYREMPLVHLSQQGGSEKKENFYLSFHWEKLRGDVAKDVEWAESRDFK